MSDEERETTEEDREAPAPPSPSKTTRFPVRLERAIPNRDRWERRIPIRRTEPKE